MSGLLVDPSETLRGVEAQQLLPLLIQLLDLIDQPHVPVHSLAIGVRIVGPASGIAPPASAGHRGHRRSGPASTCLWLYQDALPLDLQDLTASEPVLLTSL